MRGVWNSVEDMFHIIVKRSVARQFGRKLLLLRPVRKFAVNQQVGRFDERGFFGEFLDRNSAITQDSLLAVDKGDPALARAGISVAVVQGNVGRLRPELADINRLFAFGSDHGGQLELHSVNVELCLFFRHEDFSFFGRVYHKSFKTQPLGNLGVCSDFGRFSWDILELWGHHELSRICDFDL